jgi:octaprenyl-diphosphate synthase
MSAGQDLPARVDEIIGRELEDVERIFRQELESHNPYVNDVFAHVTRFRGKRLRPMLLLLSASAAGGVNEHHKILAAVVEMIHTATLVHDDVLDDATTRRHVATVNTRWNTETSVLFGDYLFTHAFHLASSLPSTLACRLIGRATNIVCEGELSQIRERGNLHLTEEKYLQIIDAKTAELCALCCFLGAHFAGADEKTSIAMREYGRSLGTTFQISDDLLDILGTEKATGKTLGSDIAKQKLTLPLIRLLDRSSGPAAARIRELIARPGEASRAELAAHLESSDALDYARARAFHFADESRRQLALLGDSAARRILEEITEFVAVRSH